MKEILKRWKSKIIDDKNLYIFIICFFISVIIFGLGINKENFYLTLIGIWINYLIGIVYSIKDIKNRMYYFMFFCVIFVFLLSRPTINIFRGNSNFCIATANEKWALISIYISVIGLLVGGFISNKIKSNTKNIEDNEGFIKNNLNIIKKISFILFIVSFIAKMIVEIDKYVFMIGENYEKYYILYQNNLPYIITALEGMMVVFLMIFLITMPSKKITIVVLVMYVFTNIPMLLIGERGSIVKAIIFAFLYVWYRNSKESNIKWIGKKEKIFICIMIPIGIIGLSIYNYTRSDEEIPSYNPVNIVTDFFYKQGVTYDVLSIGYKALDKLPNRENKNYTFGGFIDYIKYNSISTKIFGVEKIPAGNNVIRATETNDFSHAMSYVAKEDYLQGHRMGVIIFIRNLC